MASQETITNPSSQPQLSEEAPPSQPNPTEVTPSQTASPTLEDENSEPKTSPKPSPLITDILNFNDEDDDHSPVTSERGSGPPSGKAPLPIVEADLSKLFIHSKYDVLFSKLMAFKTKKDQQGLAEFLNNDLDMQEFSIHCPAWPHLIKNLLCFRRDLPSLMASYEEIVKGKTEEGDMKQCVLDFVVMNSGIKVLEKNELGLEILTEVSEQCRRIRLSAVLAK